MAKDLIEKVLQQAQTPVYIGSIRQGVVVPISGNSSDLIVGMDDTVFDAFGRQRVSAPFTIFDSKQLSDNLPLFWDDAQVSGAGTGSVFDANKATTTISVSNATAGKRVRQTFRRFNYEPGKSQLIFMTFATLNTGLGITKEVGYGNNDNGLFLVSDSGVLYFRQRSNVTGSPVDTDVPQTEWNVDKLDGNGNSGLTLDATKAQILFIDFEWLAVGRVRFGFVIHGKIVLCHEFNNANNLDTVYMSTPNLPLRYSIENDGTGAADSFDHICSSVISEGGSESIGKTGYVSLGISTINGNTVGTIYALVGLRLKSSAVGATIQIEDLSILMTTNDDFEWLLVFNPTIAGGGLTWSDVPNYSVQQGLGNIAGNPSTTTITGGTIIAGGHGTGFSSIKSPANDTLVIGSAIDGTVDEIVLCVRPITSNTDISGGMNFRELG